MEEMQEQAETPGQLIPGNVSHELSRCQRIATVTVAKEIKQFSQL